MQSLVAAVPGRRDRNRQRTQRAISAAALRLAAEHGFDHVTVEMIAEAAEVSPRTFSNYFTGKDDAVLRMDPEPAAAFAAAFAAVPADVPLLAALRTVLVTTATAMDGHAEDMELRMTIMRDAPRLRAAFVARFALVEQTVTRGIAERLGVDPATDRRPLLLAGVLGSVMRGSLGHRREHDPTAKLPDLVAAGFDLLVTTLTV